MVGGAIKVSPVLEALGDKTKLNSYFPAGKWVNLANPKEVIGKEDAGGYYDLDATTDTVNAHLRPGTLIPW